jgi:cytochrome c biogenesis protein CcmG, thiol:disulfide interchange protein DsbE
MNATEAAPVRRRRIRILPLIPLAGFLALSGLFLIRLGGGDASLIPSALIGKPAPQFDLPPIAGLPADKGLSNADLKQGHVTLVNVFASWCIPCRDEHPVLLTLSRDKRLAAEGVRLVGIAYKDDPANALKFLADNGNPYATVGADRSGRTGIDFGVYGVPETYVIRGDGVISYKFIGPMTDQDVATTLQDEIAKAMQGAS